MNKIISEIDTNISPNTNINIPTKKSRPYNIQDVQEPPIANDKIQQAPVYADTCNIKPHIINHTNNIMKHNTTTTSTASSKSHRQQRPKSASYKPNRR